MLYLTLKSSFSSKLVGNCLAVATTSLTLAAVASSPYPREVSRSPALEIALIRRHMKIFQSYEINVLSLPSPTPNYRSQKCQMRKVYFTNNFAFGEIEF